MTTDRPRRKIPHLGVGEPRRYLAYGFRQIDRATACGRRVATTLTTNRADLVRCTDCRRALTSIESESQ